MSRYSEPFGDAHDDLGGWENTPPEFNLHPDPAAALAALAATLTKQQAEAAAQAGPILVLAGAGTGKTSTLTAAVVQRIAADRFSPSRILAVTFTNKAAKEMAVRIRASLGGIEAPSWLGTYHGLAARQLRDQPEIAGLRPGFDILDADDSRRLLKRTMKALNLAGGGDETETGRDPLKIMATEFAKFKDNLVTPQGATAWINAKIDAAERSGELLDVHGLRASAQVYADYQHHLREGNAADFGDLLLWPTLALQRDENYRDLWASRFDCLLADEYQDVNFAQYSWLKALAADHKRLFVVGDDDQAIYSWRGSDIAYIRRFARDFPDALQIRLEENFRSTGHILAAANAVIAKDKKRLGKTLFTQKAQGDPIEILGFCDAQAEASALTLESSAAVPRAPAGTKSPSSIAVTLCREAMRKRSCARTFPMSSSATSDSTSVPKSRMRSPSCALPQPLTIANRTRLSAASSMSHAAATGPKPWRSLRPRPPSAMSPFSALSRPRPSPQKPRGRIGIRGCHQADWRG